VSKQIVHEPVGETIDQGLLRSPAGQIAKRHNTDRYPAS
jgi:hypothetical protein